MKKVTSYTVKCASHNSDLSKPFASFVALSVKHPDYLDAVYLVNFHADGEGISWNKSHEVPSMDKILENAVAYPFAKRLCKAASENGGAPLSLIWWLEAQDKRKQPPSQKGA